MVNIYDIKLTIVRDTFIKMGYNHAMEGYEPTLPKKGNTVTDYIFFTTTTNE
jgi:hypothetical protein